MSIAILFDAIVAALLLLNTFYLILLSRKLRFIWNSRQEFEHLLHAFQQSCDTVETRFERLRGEGEVLQAHLQEKLTTLGTASSELNFLIDRAEILAAQLEEGVREGRQLKKDATWGQKKTSKNAPPAREALQDMVGARG